VSASVQYRVAFGRKDEAVDGPDDAALVITIDARDATGDLTELFMLGRLKAAGHTGVLFDVLRSGEASAVLARLSARA
jgi:hypothetical protein